VPLIEVRGLCSYKKKGRDGVGQIKRGGGKLVWKQRWSALLGGPEAAVVGTIIFKQKSNEEGEVSKEQEQQ